MFTQEQMDKMLYSNGRYWLFEHWNEDNSNIYSKAKYSTLVELLKGAGKQLKLEQIAMLKLGKAVTIKQDDGTTLFFKFVNNV